MGKSNKKRSGRKQAQRPSGSRMTAFSTNDASTDLETKLKIAKSLERREWSKTIRTAVRWLSLIVVLYMSQYIPKEILELLADILRDWKTLVTSIILFILTLIGYFSSKRFEKELSDLTPEDVGGSRNAL